MRSALTHSISMAPGWGATSTNAFQLDSVSLWVGLGCQPITRPGHTSASSLGPLTQTCLTSGSVGSLTTTPG